MTCTDIDEAVAQWADQVEGPLPETVEVFCFAPMEMSSAQSIADDVLERLYERMCDTEFANPEGDDDEPTPALRAAALAFAEVFRREYKVWACEQVGVEVVKVSDYYTDAR